MESKNLRVCVALACAFYAVAPMAWSQGEPDTGAGLADRVISQGTQVIDAASFNGLSNLTVEQGATAIIDFSSSGSINLAGSLNNFGTIYAATTGGQQVSASFSAYNIVNGSGALLTSVLPSSGLAGFNASTVPLSLNLTAINNVINQGTISSSGNLAITAGGTITNQTAAIMSAVQSINLVAGQIINQGSIAAMTGNLNINFAVGNLLSSQLSNLASEQLSLSNLAGVLSALNGDINITSAAGDLTLDNSNGRIEALNSINITDMLSDAHIGVRGGDFVSRDLNVAGGVHSQLSVHANSITGEVDATGCNLSIGTVSGGLNINQLNLSGDPLIYSMADGVALDLGSFSGTFDTHGEDFVVLSGGDILYSGGPATITTAKSGDFGGKITLMAGVTFSGAGSPNPIACGNCSSNYAITGLSPSGGSVDAKNLSFSSGGGEITIEAKNGYVTVGNISAAATSAGYSGGNVAVTASGKITAGDITTSAQGNQQAQAGNVSLTSGGGLSIGNIVMNGAPGMAGNNVYGGNAGSLVVTTAGVSSIQSITALGADGAPGSVIDPVSLEGEDGGSGGAGGSVTITGTGTLTINSITTNGGTGHGGFGGTDANGTDNGGAGGAGGSGANAGDIIISIDDAEINAVTTQGGSAGNGGTGGDATATLFNASKGGVGGAAGNGGSLTFTGNSLKIEKLVSTGGTGGDGGNGGTAYPIPGSIYVSASRGGDGGKGGNGGVGGSITINAKGDVSITELRSIGSSAGSGGKGGTGSTMAGFTAGTHAGYGGDGGSGGSGGAAGAISISAASYDGTIVQLTAGDGGAGNAGNDGGQLLSMAVAGGYAGDGGAGGLGGGGGDTGALSITVQHGITIENVKIQSGKGGGGSTGGSGGFTASDIGLLTGAGNGGKGGKGAEGGDTGKLNISGAQLDLGSVSITAGSGGVGGRGGLGGGELSLPKINSTFLNNTGAGGDGEQGGQGGETGAVELTATTGHVLLSDLTVTAGTGGDGGNGYTGGNGTTGGGRGGAGGKGADAGIVNGVTLTAFGDITFSSIRATSGTGGGGGEGGLGGTSALTVGLPTTVVGTGGNGGSGGIGGAVGPLTITSTNGNVMNSGGSISLKSGSGGYGAAGGNAGGNAVTPYTGGDGGNGGDGGDGGFAGPIALSITAAGNVSLGTINIAGGNGGSAGTGSRGALSTFKAGSGGKGGSGGRGEDAGQVNMTAGGSLYFNTLSLTGGVGADGRIGGGSGTAIEGQAGAGGFGGNGGNGGNTGAITITTNTGELVGAISAIAGSGGRGGDGHTAADAPVTVRGGGDAGHGGDGGSTGALTLTSEKWISSAGFRLSSGDGGRGGDGGNGGGGAADAGGGGNGGSGGIGGASGNILLTAKLFIQIGDVSTTAGNGGRAGDGLSGGNAVVQGGRGGSAGVAGVGGTAGNIAMASPGLVSTYSIVSAGGTGGDGGAAGSGGGSLVNTSSHGGDAGNATSGADGGSSGSIALSSGDTIQTTTITTRGGNGGLGGYGRGGGDSLVGGDATAGGNGGRGGVANNITLSAAGSIKTADISTLGGAGGSGSRGGNGGYGEGSGGDPGHAGTGGQGGAASSISLIGGADVSVGVIHLYGGSGGTGGDGGLAGGSVTTAKNSLYGGNGGDGGSAGAVTLTAGGTFTAGEVLTYGGAGGKGGQGGEGRNATFSPGSPGHGGDGGKGGDAGNMDLFAGNDMTISSAYGGGVLAGFIASVGGAGGKGGNGNSGGIVPLGASGRNGSNGGNGGDSGYSGDITIGAGRTLTFAVVQAAPDAPGDGGDGGNGGAGLSPGRGGDGGRGGNGSQYGFGGNGGHGACCHFGRYASNGAQGPNGTQILNQYGSVVVSADIITGAQPLIEGGSVAAISNTASGQPVLVKPRNPNTTVAPLKINGMNLAYMIQRREIQTIFATDLDVASLHLEPNKDLVILATGNVYSSNPAAGISLPGRQIVIGAGNACCVQGDAYTVGGYYSGAGSINLSGVSLQTSTSGTPSGGSLIFLNSSGIIETGSLQAGLVMVSAAPQPNGPHGINLGSVNTSNLYASTSVGRFDGSVNYSLRQMYVVPTDAVNVRSQAYGANVGIFSSVVGQFNFTSTEGGFADPGYYIYVAGQGPGGGGLTAYSGNVTFHTDREVRFLSHVDGASVVLQPNTTGVNIGVGSGASSSGLRISAPSLSNVVSNNLLITDGGQNNNIYIGSYSAPTSGAGAFKLALSTTGIVTMTSQGDFTASELDIDAGRLNFQAGGKLSSVNADLLLHTANVSLNIDMAAGSQLTARTGSVLFGTVGSLTINGAGNGTISGGTGVNLTGLPGGSSSVTVSVGAINGPVSASINSSSGSLSITTASGRLKTGTMYSAGGAVTLIANDTAGNPLEIAGPVTASGLVTMHGYSGVLVSGAILNSSPTDRTEIASQNATITLGANVTSGADLTLSAKQDITRTAGTLKAQSVSLSTNNFAIGDDTTRNGNIFVDTPSLSLHGSQVAVLCLSNVTLSNSTFDSSLHLTTDNGNITVTSVTSTNPNSNLRLSATAAGNIDFQTPALNPISVGLLQVETDTGNIGTATSPLNITGGRLMANTNGQGSVYVHAHSSLEILDSSAGNVFQISSDDSITSSNDIRSGGSISLTAQSNIGVQYLTALNGSVSLSTGNLSAAQTQIHVKPGGIILANEGNVIIQNVSPNGSILIDSNAVVGAVSTGSTAGQVQIFTAPVFTFNLGAKPAQYVHETSVSGFIAYGTSGITAEGPRDNNIVSVNGLVGFESGGRQNSIVIKDGALIGSLGQQAPMVTLRSLDLTDASVVSTIQTLQASGHVGGKLEYAAGMLSGTVILSPANLYRDASSNIVLTAENIPQSVVVSFKGFNGDTALNYLLNAQSTSKQFIAGGTHAFTGSQTSDGVINITSNQSGPVLLVQSGGQINSNGTLTITANGSMTINGQLKADEIKLNATNGGDLLFSASSFVANQLEMQVAGNGKLMQSGTAPIAVNNLVLSTATDIALITSAAKISVSTPGSFNLYNTGKDLQITPLSSSFRHFTVVSDKAVNITGAVDTSAAGTAGNVIVLSGRDLITSNISANGTTAGFISLISTGSLTAGDIANNGDNGNYIVMLATSNLSTGKISSNGSSGNGGFITGLAGGKLTTGDISATATGTGRTAGSVALGAGSDLATGNVVVTGAGGAAGGTLLLYTPQTFTGGYIDASSDSSAAGGHAFVNSTGMTFTATKPATTGHTFGNSVDVSSTSGTAGMIYLNDASTSEFTVGSASGTNRSAGNIAADGGTNGGTIAIRGGRFFTVQQGAELSANGGSGPGGYISIMSNVSLYATVHGLITATNNSDKQGTIQFKTASGQSMTLAGTGKVHAGNTVYVGYPDSGFIFDTVKDIGNRVLPLRTTALQSDLIGAQIGSVGGAIGSPVSASRGASLVRPMSAPITASSANSNALSVKESTVPVLSFQLPPAVLMQAAKTNGSPVILPIEQTPAAVTPNETPDSLYHANVEFNTFSLPSTAMQYQPKSEGWQISSSAIYSADCIRGSSNTESGLTQVSNSNNMLSFILSHGAGLFGGDNAMQIQTREGTVQVERGALAFVIETGNDVSVYNLHSSYNLHTVKVNGVKVVVGGKYVEVPLGRQLVLTRKSNSKFEDVNPGGSIASRNASRIDFHNGVTGYLAEFSILSAVENISPLHAMLRSSLPDQQKRGQQILKNAAIIATLTKTAGPYKKK